MDESHFSEDEKFEKRLSILASYGEDTLLIIDNMDTHPADRENYVRLKELPIHILFTSRETAPDPSAFQARTASIIYALRTVYDPRR